MAVPVFDPRPEYDHTQHNEPNPILVDARLDDEFNPSHILAHLLGYAEAMDASSAHIDHARRVLERLIAMQS